MAQERESSLIMAGYFGVHSLSNLFIVHTPFCSNPLTYSHTCLVVATPTFSSSHTQPHTWLLAEANQKINIYFLKLACCSTRKSMSSLLVMYRQMLALGSLKMNANNVQSLCIDIWGSIGCFPTIRAEGSLYTSH